MYHLKKKKKRFDGFIMILDSHISIFIFSYNRLGSNAEEADAEEIIDLASKASLDDQQKQVQENIHFQVKVFCTAMDDVLLPSIKKVGERFASGSDSPRRSGLSLAIGKPSSPVQQAGEHF